MFYLVQLSKETTSNQSKKHYVGKGGGRLKLVYTSIVLNEMHKASLISHSTSGLGCQQIICEATRASSSSDVQSHTYDHQLKEYHTAVKDVHR